MSQEMNSEIYHVANYGITTLEDEIRVDGLCRQLLQHFHQYLLREKCLEPLEAGALAGGADFFLRDYMIDKCRANLFEISAARISGFAGNWYIVSTLEPNLQELNNILKGICLFYCFCAEKDLIEDDLLQPVESSCGQLDFYRQRISSFHALEGDGFGAWNASCPVSGE